ncbi:hypothetical protein [Rhizobium favelukesii]|uniref:hypothetical protein n=1 Tax=Rhizobium favelukesii TaxID=348824 RepID=UPI00215E5ED1|nr:hypothetical protein [Rhizobium favelukesii]MCS0459491.1 hypothetical protein [Rhizobium favelukesii]
MTRDKARALFAVSGLTYNSLRLSTMNRLRDIVDEELKASGLIEKYAAERKVELRFVAGGIGIYGQITCKSYYFNKREAVSFNPDGFIGFAGWADENNVQPILTAFCRWVAEMTSEKRKAA